MGCKRNVEMTNVSEEVKRLYASKKGLKQVSIEEFKNWYESKKGCCDYCGLTSQESLILFHKYPNSTRGGRRGKRLELDRIDLCIKNYGQDISNLALACYWCNNAKTNYFTFEEFKIIGEQIKVVQNNRINLIKGK